MWLINSEKFDPQIYSFLFLLVGLPPSKTKLELQKHLTTLNNQEQASVFEEVQVSFVSYKILKQLVFFANIYVKHRSHFHFLWIIHFFM